MQIKVYIILLNYNGWKDTIECLESVLKSDYENYQIIVVDNDSPNNSMEYIVNWAKGKQEVVYDENSQLKHLSQPFEPKPLDYVFYTKDEALKGGIQEQDKQYKNPIIFIQAGENGGFAAGNNIGIKYALVKDDFEYVWLLNNDTVIEKDTLSKLVKSFEEKKNDTNLGILGSKLFYYNVPNILQAVCGVYFDWKARSSHFGSNTQDFHQYDNQNTINKMSYIVGASMFISKKFIRDIGLMSEDYFLYYEELDWIERGKTLSYSFSIAFDTKVYHKEGNTIGTNNNSILQSELSSFYLARSHRKFVLRHKNYYTQVILFLRYIGIVLKKLLRGRIYYAKLIFLAIFTNTTFEFARKK